MGNPIDMVGRRFGRLVVLERAADYMARGKPTRMWVCQCDCGRLSTTYGNALRGGTTKSCGCFGVESFLARVTSHGMHKAPEYKLWTAMRRRCNDQEDPAYDNYGGRGVRVCARWNESFQNFWEDMGPRPARMTLDRRDNDGDYARENCQWSTYGEQSRNKRTNVFITFEGETMVVADWAARFNTSGTAISARWKKFGTLHPIRTPRNKISAPNSPTKAQQ